MEEHQVSEEEEEAQQQILGHGPGQGCDFCDNLRLERANGLKEEDGEEEEEEEEWERPPLDNLDTIAETTETLFDDEGKEEGVSMDDSQTLRAAQEERIIDRYLKSSSSSMAPPRSRPPPPPPSSHYRKSSNSQSQSVRSRSPEINMQEQRRDGSVYMADERGHRGQGGHGRRKRRNKEDEEEEEKKKRASQWARSYTRLVDAM